MKILIVGGGITGLSCAWDLLSQNPKAKITLLEKENRLGGWIRTSREGGFLFEKGPRTFQLGRCPNLLALIRSLGLDLIRSSPQKRYLLYKGKLRSLSYFLPMLIPSLLREPFVPSATCADESIYTFASRRFSPKIANTLFDPLTLGIYGGDIHQLSIRACFPSLYRFEREKGSVLRGMFSSPKQPKGLFTIASGMETLIDTLKQKLPIEMVLNCHVDSITTHQVTSGNRVWDGDRVISALPPSLPARSIWVVNLGYTTPVLPKQGYGYLVPTQERESLLGVIFDSSIFPEQNKEGETRLTAMIRAEEKEPLKAALSALARHLGIESEPAYTSTYLASNAIPQFEVGCNYTEGISVEACVERGKRLSLES